MSTSTNNPSNNRGQSPLAADSYRLEMEQVQRLLLAVAEELTAPLRGLVLAEIRGARPLARAAVVLAAGVGAPDDAALAQKRTDLAGALELLYVAHQIHKLLLSEAVQELDKSLLGSTILAGDYCFSQSAALAARTESPDVVRIFAAALRNVSEGDLRALFAEVEEPFDENCELLRCGALAAAALSGCNEAEQAAISAFVETLAQDPAKAVPSAPPLPLQQLARWQLLPAWLIAPSQEGSL